MGKSSTEIEHDIALQREALSGRISRLERRVGDDLASARERAAEHVSSLGDRAGAALGTEAGSDSALAHHPKALVGGALAGGFVLGRLGGKDEPAGTVKHRDHMLGQSKARWPSLAGKRKQESTQDSGPLAAAAAALLGIARSWGLHNASGLLKAASEGLSTGIRGAAGRGTREKEEEVVPAVSGSAKVGYDEPLEPPPPLEKAANRMGVRVGR